MVPPTQRYCSEHRRLMNRQYEEVRDKEFRGIYGSNRWRKLREIVLKRDGGLCQQCRREGRITVADVVDHIVELRDGGCAFCEDNLESLCHACHAKKTARERKKRG